jgi:hypothetical protein
VSSYMKRSILFNELGRISCGGRLEYHNRSPASRRERGKRNLMPGCITGPLCHWGTQGQRPGPPGWGVGRMADDLAL